MGTDGPVSISYNREYTASHQYWHETLNKLGISTNKSHLSGSNVGVWTNVVSVNPQTMTRSYSADSHYHSVAKNRRNLTVLTNALVQEVKIEQVDGVLTATGVAFAHGNQRHTVSASQEVILSAGSVVSPQLLELSGIGDPKVLEAAGIAVKIANPNVGQNLQDHICKQLSHPYS
jgi:choline dehydrogenase-like flavoprotein